jgi:ketosteroid isomerase-like protein
MSQENVEIVRHILTEWETGDFTGGARLFDPEITFETFMPDTKNAVAHGFDELQVFMRDWLAQWRNYRIYAKELKDVGPDTVFAIVTQAATGHESGVEVESPGYSIWTLRDGKVTKLSLHYDRDKALEAAGLRE